MNDEFLAHGLPIQGCVERRVLDALMANPEGVTHLDLGLTEEEMDAAISNLRTGMYPGEADASMGQDA